MLGITLALGLAPAVSGVQVRPHVRPLARGSVSCPHYCAMVARARTTAPGAPFQAPPAVVPNLLRRADEFDARSRSPRQARQAPPNPDPNEQAASSSSSRATRNYTHEVTPCGAPRLATQPVPEPDESDENNQPEDLDTPVDVHQGTPHPPLDPPHHSNEVVQGYPVVPNISSNPLTPVVEMLHDMLIDQNRAIAALQRQIRQLNSDLNLHRIMIDEINDRAWDPPSVP